MSISWKKLSTFPDKHPVAWALILFVLLAAVRFFPFFLGKTLYFGDNYSLMVPGKIFTAQWLQQGVLPFWNPYIFAGVNWIGDVNQSALYFTTLFFIWFPPATALNISIFLHTVLTGLGMYLFSKKLFKTEWQAILSGILWMFSTHVSGSSNNLSTIQSIAWIPWLLWASVFVTKKSGARIGFALLVLGQFLAGYPQHVVYSILMAVIVSWWYERSSLQFFKWLRAWAITGILTILISAIVWLPFAESLLLSTRVNQSSGQAQVGSLDPAMLPKMILTYIFDHPSRGVKWGPAWSGQPNVVFYVGWISLMAVGYSLKNWKKSRTSLAIFSALVVGLTLFFSFGKFLPFYEQIQALIPFLRVGRYPSMVLMFTNLFLIIWAVEALKNLKFEKTFLYTVFGFLSLLVLGSGGVLYAITYHADQVWQLLNVLTHQALAHSQFHTQARDMAILSVLAENVIVVSAITIGSVFAVFKKHWWIVTGFLAIELIYSTQGMFIFGDKKIYNELQSAQIPIRDELQKNIQDQQYRILTRNSNQPYSDYGSYWEALVVRAPFSDSFIDNEELKTQTRLTALRDGFTPDWNMVFKVPMIHGYTALLPRDFANIWQKSSETRINFIDTVASSDPNLRSWAVKYYVVDSWYPTYSEKLPTNKVARVGEWDIYELPDTLPRVRFENGMAVDLSQFVETPNTVALEFPKLEQPQTLIIADRFDKNWKAQVNGRDLPIINSDGMRKIALPVGASQLKMQFVPQLFFAGSVISIVSIVLLWIWWYYFDLSKHNS
jgi:hypothetical protein